MARARGEQASAIEALRGAVRVLDAMTQHNATPIEQSIAAFEQSAAEARHLDEVIDAFTLNAPEGVLARLHPGPRGHKSYTKFRRGSNS